MGGDGGFSEVNLQIGDQTWVIGDYEYLGFYLNTTPGESLTASILTSGEGSATLDIANEGPYPTSPVPEPGTLLQLMAVAFIAPIAKIALDLFWYRTCQ